MPDLRLSIAMGDYDRTRPLLDGNVLIDGVNPVFMTLSPEEMFFRAFRHVEFDVCELSLSSYLIKLSREECPYTAVPVFLSRAFRHNSIYVRKDRISKPEDLNGARIGIPEYQLTAIVWARAILEEDYGIKMSDISWVRGGIDQPGRLEKIGFNLPDGINIQDAPGGQTISSMLAEGGIDAFIAPRPPGKAADGNPDIGYLFPDPIAEAMDYCSRTGIFPIMHVLGIRNELVNQHPWLAFTLLKSFTIAKDLALERLADTSASKVTLPFIEEQLKRIREKLGRDFWSYGVKDNINTLNTFLRHHYKQGLSARQMSLEEIFHPSTYESYKI